jgi:hypothetical protein
MRKDHVFHYRPGDAMPSSEEIEQVMRRARRIRSEAVHALLAAAATWIRAALHRAPAPRNPVGQSC